MSSDKLAIEQILASDYPKHVNASDAAGYASMYSANALWSPPGGPDQTSRTDIETAVTSLFQRVRISVKTSTDEVEIAGSSAFVVGLAIGTVTTLEDSESTQFKYRLVWLMRKEGEAWRISHQVWNNKPIE